MNPKLPSNPKPPQREITASVEISKSQRFSGPLPPPETLRDYEIFVPGSADRIIAMAEKQGDHRRELEAEQLSISRLVVEKSFNEARWGQVCAVAVSIAFLVAATYLGISGKEWAASFIGTSGMAGIVTAFLSSRKDWLGEGDKAEEETQLTKPPSKKPPPKKR